MGYQEAFRPIEHLAESVGIKRAIEDYKDNPYIPEYCHYCCTARSKASGRLYACVIGQRCRVHIVAGCDVDDRVPYGESYSDYYEDLDESLVEAAAKERPDMVERAYREIAEAFDSAEENGRREAQALRDEAIALWPKVAKTLQFYGPKTERFFSSHPLFKGHFMWNVLVDLEWQGLLQGQGTGFNSTWWFSDAAMQTLGVSNDYPKRDSMDEIVFLLDECGPLGTGKLSDMLEVSTYRTRTLLRNLIDSGRVVAEGNGRARKYRLAVSPKQRMRQSTQTTYSEKKNSS